MNLRFILLFLLILLPLCGAFSSTEAAQTGFLKTHDGYRLFFRKLGNGPHVIVIPLDVFVYDGLSSLSRADRTLIFYDPRNRGRSESVSDLSKISVENDVQDIDAVRQHFSLKKFHLIGYSVFGMEVALYAASHPEYVERLIQLGPVPLKFGTKYPKEFDNTTDRSPFDKDLYAELEKLGASHYDELHPQEYCRKELTFYAPGLVTTPGGFKRLQPTLAKVCGLRNEWPVNFRKQLKAHFEGSVLKLSVAWNQMTDSIKMPVLVIHGLKDRNAPYGSGREWASKLPNARLLTLENAAHQSWVDQPEIVISAINTFLDGNWPKLAVRPS